MKAVPVPSSPSPSPSASPSASPPPSPPGAPSAKTLAALADALTWPLFVLRRDGGLLHANRAARQALDRGQPLLVTPLRRVAPAAATRRAGFEQALAAVAAGQPHGLLRWPGPRGGHTAMLAPLPGADAGQPAVLLALGAADGQAVDTRGFAALHGLSEAETRVLERLALGESSVDAAAALGVKPATVRSQAMAMRRKTGHASVADMLRALAAMPPVILGGGPPRQGE